MFFLPPGDVELVKKRAINEGRWEDLGNGYISKKPKPKQASVQFAQVGKMQDDGRVTLSISVLHAKVETTRIHYAEDAEVSEASPRLSDDSLQTSALRVAFLAVDSSGQCPSAPPVVWTNKLQLQWDLSPPVQGQRSISLKVLPRADEIRYTLNGAEPRNGTLYQGPFKVDGQAGRLLVFAQAADLEAKQDFAIPASTPPKGGTPVPDPLPLTRPVRYPTQRDAKINARDKVFDALNKAQERHIQFTDLDLRITDNNATGQFSISGQSLPAAQALQALQALVASFGPAAPVVMSFRAQFPSGQDLQDFAQAFDLDYTGQWSEQL